MTQGLTVQGDLKGSGGQEVSLHHVAEEEGHETREDLETQEVRRTHR